MKENYKEDLIMLAIPIQYFQQFAEANLGRELNDVELKRMYEVICDEHYRLNVIISALLECARYAMSEDEDWSNIDEQLKDESLKEVFSEFNRV